MVTSWIMPYGQLGWLRALDDDLARRCFDTPTSYVVGGPIPAYATTPVRLFRSFSTYQAANVAVGQVVCFDIEHWPGSDDIEQRHLELAFRDFANEAKLRGNMLICAPGRDLVYCPGSETAIGQDEDINAAYLRCRIPAYAYGAQVLLVQAQGSQKDLDAFTGLICGAREQQPDGQALWAGLTTGKSTADQMLAAAAAVAGVVSGFWVTIGSKDQAPVAAEFFRGWLAGRNA